MSVGSAINDRIIDLFKYHLSIIRTLTFAIVVDQLFNTNETI